MMPRRPSGTGILPVRSNSNGQNARAAKYNLFRFSLLLSALFAVAAMEPPSQPITLPPAQAAKEGRALVNEMLSQPPGESTTTGVMAIRHGKSYQEIPIKFQTIVRSNDWVSVYEATRKNGVEYISIIHSAGQTNRYLAGETSSINNLPVAGQSLPAPLSAQQITAPFAGSDFSIADLGLEFLHWPDQKLLQKEMKRSRSCLVLESTNPHPTAGGYFKVKSWVDNESHGILLAQAFDAKGNKIKEFIPGDFSKSKATGQWQLGKMQITNPQNDYTTTVQFDVDK